MTYRTFLFLTFQICSLNTLQFMKQGQHLRYIVKVSHTMCKSTKIKWNNDL